MENVTLGFAYDMNDWLESLRSHSNLIINFEGCEYVARNTKANTVKYMKGPVAADCGKPIAAKSRKMSSLDEFLELDECKSDVLYLYEVLKYPSPGLSNDCIWVVRYATATLTIND